MARPEIDISAEQVYKLAKLGAKTVEIADFFNCSVDTIDRRFAEELTKGKAELKISLRKWQLEHAQKGNASLLIWLGKQMLDQVDKFEVAGDKEAPLNLTLNYERKKKPSSE